MSRFRCIFVMFVVLCVGGFCFGEEMLLLSGGTVVADTYYECEPEPGWFGESVTMLTIGTVEVGENEYIEISGKITEVSDLRDCYVEIGLIPKGVYEYWQEWGEDGECESAVFNKGLHVVSWFEDSGAVGASLQEGWNNGKVAGPYAWPLNRPSQANPWEFSISMCPLGSTNGVAYFWMSGGNLWWDEGVFYDMQPFVYGEEACSEENGNICSDNDYSECYLIAQIWSEVPDAEFSFKHVRARVMKNKNAVE